VVYHEETLACQKMSKQMAGNRKSASTCFRAGLARIEVAMVYIFGMATRQLTPWSIVGGRCEKRCVQASKQTRGKAAASRITTASHGCLLAMPQAQAQRAQRWESASPANPYTAHVVQANVRGFD